MYRPLPESVTIKQSLIEGLGLFATKDIPANTNLGMTHIYDERFDDDYIRLPLGGFFNHSDKPNCKVIHEDLPFKHISLVTLVDIKAGDEITAFYTLYIPNN
jgi:SET domain